jgi:NAD(P)-dependent dehydrogenase (short-subunit alcohol dehydrogenase family)
MFNLKGKVAIVTGGAGHLGSAISEGLAECGADVVIASRDVDKCEELAGKIRDKYKNTLTTADKLDVSSQGSIRELIVRTVNQFDRIDILVNNAVYTDKEDFTKTLGGTVVQTYNCCMAAIPYMKQGGSIINISSIYGLLSDHPQKYSPFSGLRSPSGYGIGKGAIITLTKHLACQFSADKWQKAPIRVNSVTFGAFPKPSVQENVTFIKGIEELIPLGRIGQPKEAVGAVVFLASDEASYVTGSNLIVDGGWTIW